MCTNKYLTTDNLRYLLSTRVFVEVMALPKDTPILVTGKAGRTGKTTVVQILEKLGYTNVKDFGLITHTKNYVNGQWYPEYAIVLNETLPKNI